VEIILPPTRETILKHFVAVTAELVKSLEREKEDGCEAFAEELKTTFQPVLLRNFQPQKLSK
jgi:hypothetical protein